MAHTAGEVSVQSVDQQMILVGHETIGGNFKIKKNSPFPNTAPASLPARLQAPISGLPHRLHHRPVGYCDRSGLSLIFGYRHVLHQTLIEAPPAAILPSRER